MAPRARAEKRRGNIQGVLDPGARQWHWEGEKELQRRGAVASAHPGSTQVNMALLLGQLSFLTSVARHKKAFVRESVSR